MRIPVYSDGRQGFSLVEMMLALFILTFGLLATGQLLYVTASSSSLARSKGTAALAAQSVLESLDASYRQDPLTADLVPGNHGPRRSLVTNPMDGTVLNSYDVNWAVDIVPDPRPGKVLNARLVRATVTPVQIGGAQNARHGFNKIVSVTTILGSRVRG
ncbi:MAG TPA: prepilin-type N-terminal cleavage/methylation domain-containing protein [Acidobacteriota bacterium]|nr:prepilin-type N-terminal cleavage/methylation domain-containing protein [Acidobacteriota bacterium]